MYNEHIVAADTEEADDVEEEDGDEKVKPVKHDLVHITHLPPHCKQIRCINHTDAIATFWCFFCLVLVRCLTCHSIRVFCTPCAKAHNLGQPLPRKKSSQESQGIPLVYT